ncbi:MAG: CotH kinase family protein [Oscillospiraceae bacterium]|nr:CotH kinase family protein [Oscillospiraceae bacterium]
MKKRTAVKKTIILIAMCTLITALLGFDVFAVEVEENTVHADGPVDNGIPVVYINIDESRGTIYDMIDSVDHSVYCYGTVSIAVPKGFHYSDLPDNVCETLEGLEMSIRGRGNSTWERSAKKPFKLKLEEKADIFGLGENKHWVLLANAFDETLIRDRMTAWLGDEMGFEFTPRGVPVDVVLTGQEYGTEYLGSYYLSENVRVGKNRLEIDELKEDDTDPQTITGGYLLQNSFQVDKDSPDRFKTSRGAEWATHTPSFDPDDVSLGNGLLDSQGQENFTGAELGDGYKNNAQQKYIQDWVQHFEDVLFEEGTEYRDMMDLPSAAKYWLIQEFSMNGDAYATGSTYFYKTRDTGADGGKIYWGPLWDFDFAWDHQMLRETLDYGHFWIKPMLYDTGEGGFVKEVHKQWITMKDALIRITEEGGILDQYLGETRASAEMNMNRYMPDAELSYDEEVEELRQWIIGRMEWIDANLGMIDDMIHKVTFIKDGEVYKTDFVAVDEGLEIFDLIPEKEGYVFLGWADESGNIVENTLRSDRDITLTATYISNEEATHGKDIAFGKNSDVRKHNVHIFMYQIPHVVIPEDAIDRTVEWSSDNEEWATVATDGMVTYNGPGSATFTARLPFGETRQFTLTITEDEPAIPVYIGPEEEEIKIIPGEQGILTIETNPENAHVDELIYESEDESVVTVGDLGVLTAVAVGETNVKVTAITYNEEGEEVVNENTVKVIVKEPGPDWNMIIPYAVAGALLLIALVICVVIAVKNRKKED